jgi:hypothetical protein
MPTLKRAVLSLVFSTGLALLNGCADRTEKAKAISPTHSPLRECAVSNRQVNLAWEDTSNELGFEIERKEGFGGTYRQIAKVGENATTYTDPALKTGVTYYYRIRAYNSAGHSSYSDEICVEITAD